MLSRKSIDLLISILAQTVIKISDPIETIMTAKKAMDELSAELDRLEKEDG